MSADTPHNFMVSIGQKAGESGRANKYDPAHCDTVRALAQDGHFPESWCATIGISKSTLYVWADKYPDFAQACEIGWILLAHYWTDFTRKNLTNPDLKTAPLLKVLSTRFPSIYGKNPRFTEDNFRDRNLDLTAAGITDGGDGKSGKTKAELLELIKVYEARRQHTGGKE